MEIPTLDPAEIPHENSEVRQARDQFHILLQVHSDQQITIPISFLEVIKKLLVIDKLIFRHYL